MTPQIAPALGLQTGTMSESSRLFSLWTNPARTFQDIAQRPTFLIPLILSTLTAIAYATSTSRSLPITEVEALQTVTGTAAGVLLQCVLAAAVLTLVAARVYSAPVPFQRLLAIVSYSMLPGAVIGLFAVILIKFQLAAGMAPHSPIATNLAAFLDPNQTSRFLYSLANSADIVVLWEIALIAQGLRVASRGRLSNATALRAVLFPWAIFVIGKAAVLVQ